MENTNEGDEQIFTIVPVVPVDNQNEEKECKKRIAQESIDNNRESKKPTIPPKKFLSHIPYEYLTPEVLEECIFFGKDVLKTGKADILKIMFNYSKFAKIAQEKFPEW